MISNEFNSLRKTFGIKIIIIIMTSFPGVCVSPELLGCCCMFQSCDACKKQANYTWHNYANFTCIYDDQRLAFSILIQMVQSKISYIIDSLLSMPFFLFVVRFKVIFERLAKTLQFLKKDSLQLFQILFQSMPLHATHVNTYLKMLCTKKKLFVAQKKDFIQKHRVNFPKFKIKPFCWSFFNLLLKNFNLTLPKMYMYKVLSVGVNPWMCKW